MEDDLTDDSAHDDSSISEESLQCLAGFSTDDWGSRIPPRIGFHRGSERILYSGSSALRNPLDLPLHSHSRTCFSSNSITSSSVASASSDPLSPGLVNHDHRNQSMRYDNTWAARHRTSSSLNPHDKATKGGAATASGDSGSDPQLTKIMRAGRAYRCRLCDQDFETKSDMQRHAKETHRLDAKTHRCLKCMKPFPSTQQLAQHSLVHTNIRKYPCRFCDKAFKQLSHVQQHQRIHTGERPYRCTVDSCPKAFRQLSSLQQHIKGHNVPLPKSYTISPNCASLAVRASRPTDKIHSGVAHPHDLTCQVCEKQCLDEVRFFEHIHKYHPDYWRVLSSGRPLSDFIEVCQRDTLFTCSICQRVYSQETVYWKHMMTHSSGPSTESEELPMYDCTICCKLFTKESYLLRHLEMKLDAEHTARLEEFKKNGALFHLAGTTSHNPYFDAPFLDQIADGLQLRKGRRGGGAEGGGGDGDERMKSPVYLMPPKAHCSPVSPMYSFNASRSPPGYQTDCYNRSLSVDHLGSSLLEPDHAFVKQEIVGSLPEDEAEGMGYLSAVAGRRYVSRYTLPGCSSPRSPYPLKCHLRDNQSGSRGFYSSLYSPPGYLDDQPKTSTTGLGLLNSTRTLFPSQLLTLTRSGLGFKRSPEPHEITLEDHNPSPLNYHRTEPPPSFVQRFQPIGEGGSASAFAMSSPPFFAHSSIVSPSYGSLSQPPDPFRRPTPNCSAEDFQRPSQTMDDSFDVSCLRSASRERALQSYDQRQSLQTADAAAAAKVHLTRSFSYFESSYQPHFDPLKRDLHSYLLRTGMTETEVGMLLRRTDISDHFMATTVNHLARSVTGMR